MTTFSIIMLTLILLGIQHLLNWLYRRANEDIDLVIFAFIGTAVGIVISIVCLYHIILWGQPLILK